MIIVFLCLASLLALALVSALVYRATLQRRIARSLVIRTTDGITEGRFVRIGGIEQWIQIRGEDRKNPVLLIVSGHGLSMSAFTPLLRSWEQHFTVVQWDRRGTGKTMSRSGKAGSETWTLDLLTEDGLRVVRFLCQHLRQEKVILVGHSQGTAIALSMVKQWPDLFHAYVGTGQIVDMQRNEALSYETAIEHARTANDAKALKGLERIGAPPYLQVKTWLVKQRWSMNAASEMAVWQSLFPRMVLSAPCYSLRDVYYAFTGVLFMSQKFYNDYMAFDARSLGAFETPFFIFQGDSDVLTPTALAQEYLATVVAPVKALALLKGGGHMALLTQPEQFLQSLLMHVRAVVFANASPPQ